MAGKALNPHPNGLAEKRDALPFFYKGKRGESASWWSVKPTGNYSEDYETGQQYALAVLPMMIYAGGPSSLSMVLSDMVKAVSKRRVRSTNRDKLSGIEIGFMRGLGDLVVAAMASAAVIADPKVLNNKRGVSRTAAARIEKLTSLLAKGSLEHKRKESAKLRVTA